MACNFNNTSCKCYQVIALLLLFQASLSPFCIWYLVIFNLIFCEDLHLFHFYFITGQWPWNDFAHQTTNVVKRQIIQVSRLYLHLMLYLYRHDQCPLECLLTFISDDRHHIREEETTTTNDDTGLGGYSLFQTHKMLTCLKQWQTLSSIWHMPRSRWHLDTPDTSLRQKGKVR